MVLQRACFGPLTLLLPFFLSACGDESASCRPSEGCNAGAGGLGLGGIGGVAGHGDRVAGLGDVSGFGGSGVSGTPPQGSAGMGGSIGGSVPVTTGGTPGAGGATPVGGPTTGGGPAAGGTTPIDAGVTMSANGSICTQDSTCLSGHCAGGVCCDSPCMDRFSSCSIDGHAGACTPVTSVYVDPLNGQDDASGTMNEPLKTLKAALAAAKGGWTIYLKPGTFDASSGEEWYTKIPDGVSLQAVVEENAVLVGTGKETALEFVGTGAATGITFSGFKRAVAAETGTVSIERCTIEKGGGVELSGNVTAALDKVVLQNLESDGVYAYGSANVTVTGGSIGGVGYVADCRGAEGVYVSGAAKVRLSGVSIHDLSGDGVVARSSASVTIEDGSLTKTGEVDCAGAQVSALDASTVQLNGTSVTNGSQDGLEVRNIATLVLDRVSIGTHPYRGIYGDGGFLRVSDSSIETDSYGIELLNTCAAELTGVAFIGSKSSVNMQDSATLKMRSTRTYGNDYGIDARSSSRVRVDLGTVDDPGMNTFAATAVAAIALSGDYQDDVTINAVGNMWNPSVQGAPGSGKYSSQIIDGPCDGRNFYLGSDKLHIQL